MPVPGEMTFSECTVFDPVSNLDTTVICIDNKTAVNLGLYFRAVSRYIEAAEVCNGK